MSNGKHSNDEKFKFPANIRKVLVEALGQEAAREKRDRNAQLEYILEERYASIASEGAHVPSPPASPISTHSRKAARRQAEVA